MPANKEIKDKAIDFIKEKYDFSLRLAKKGNRDLAMSEYHRVYEYIDFMQGIDLIDYEEYLELSAEHNEFFDKLLECI